MKAKQTYPKKKVDHGNSGEDENPEDLDSDTDLDPEKDVQTALQSTDSKFPDILQWGVYSVEQTEFNVQTVLKDEKAFREKSNVQVQTSPKDVHTGSVQVQTGPSEVHTGSCDNPTQLQLNPIQSNFNPGWGYTVIRLRPTTTPPQTFNQLPGNLEQ